MSHTDAALSLKTEIEKIRRLPKGKRLEYVWEYYRLALFLIAFSLFFVCAIGSFLVNGITGILFPKAPFSIAVAAPGFSVSQAWTEECLQALDYNEKNEHFQLLTSAPLSDAADDFRINANVWMVNGQPDIFVVNESSYRYLVEMEALADLEQTWPEELLHLASHRKADPFSLDITGTPMAEAFRLTEGRVYLCMYAHGSGFARALDLVEYILTEE